MKEYGSEHWMHLNRLTPGRRGYILVQMKRAAEQLGAADIAARCAALIEQERGLQAQWKAYKTGQALATAASWSAEVLALDAQLDQLLTELRDLLEVQGRRIHTERGQASKALHDRHFAVGLTWYTHVSVEDESMRVGTLVVELAADPEAVGAAGVGEVVEEVRRVHADYAQQVAAQEKEKRPDFDALRAAELAAHRALLDTIALVLARTMALPLAEQKAQREALLGEAAAQDAEVSALARSRRKVVDVQIDTGSAEA